MNTLSPLISVHRPALWESVLFPGKWDRTLRFTVPCSFSQAFTLRAPLHSPKPPPDVSDSLNSTWAAHQTTKLIHLWLRRSNLDPIKQDTIDPLSHWNLLWWFFTTRGFVEPRLGQENENEKTIVRSAKKKKYVWGVCLFVHHVLAILGTIGHSDNHQQRSDHISKSIHVLRFRKMKTKKKNPVLYLSH